MWLHCGSKGNFIHPQLLLAEVIISASGGLALIIMVPVLENFPSYMTKLCDTPDNLQQIAMLLAALDLVIVILKTEEPLLVIQ